MKKIYLIIACACLCACGQKPAGDQPLTLRDSVAQLSEDVRQLRAKMDRAIAIQEQQALAVDSQKEQIKKKVDSLPGQGEDVLTSTAFDGHWLLGAIGSKRMHIRLHNEGFGQLKGEYYFDDASDCHYDLDGYVNSDGNITVDVLKDKEPLGSFHLKEHNGAIRGTTNTGDPLTAS